MTSETLTFLFTDIEGSTPHWDAHPEAMRVAIARHDALLREVFAARRGDTFKVVGDSFCVAFGDAGQALRAALEVQRALDRQDWGATPIRVRMGLHSGTVESSANGDLCGPSLARTARVMSAGHGGQVLLTASTVTLLEHRLPPGTTLRDLGDHTLRGFARPERIYQLAGEALASNFPPIRTEQALRTNLPPPLTRFVGRGGVLDQVRDRIPMSRIVTLTGSGGTGKTRVAFEAAGRLLDSFSGGVWVVELANVVEAARVWHAVAATLGARAEGDVSPVVLVESALRGKHVLLVLDNCEHVVDEAASVAQTLLRTLPQLHLLATSREPLGVEGELIYRIPSMTMAETDVDASADAVRASEAGELFLERARNVAPSFELCETNAAAVARICRRVDGIPLAIELAAARLTALSVEEIARRIDDRFRLLTGGLRTALPRQRTLRALVDWSYDLLSPDEQAALDALAVFSGGFSLDAAERVCMTEGASRSATILEIVERLVAKSLVIAERVHQTETRYRLLETIRQYAHEKLVDHGRADTVRRRHFDYFLRFASTASAALNGAAALEWLDRLELEHGNLRVALDWSDEAAPADYVALAGALWEFWDWRGHFTEGAQRLERALSRSSARNEARLDAMIGAGVLDYRLDRKEQCAGLLGEAVPLAQSIADIRREVTATIWLAFSRIWQGAAAFEPVASHGLALARSIGDRPREALALLLLGRAALERRRLKEAEARFLESARVYEDAGCVLGVPLAIQYGGVCAMERLDFAAARHRLDDALGRHRRLGNVHDCAATLRALADLELNERRLDDADSHSAESLRIFRALHDSNCAAGVHETRAAILRARGDVGPALEHATRAATTYRDLDFRDSLARALWTVGRLQQAAGDAPAAERSWTDALLAIRQAVRKAPIPGLLESIAALHAGDPLAPRLLGCTAALREQWQMPVHPADRADHDAGLAAVRKRHPDAAFDSAFTLGRTLGYDVAIDQALTLVKDRRT